MQFEQNVGQTDPSVAYMARGPGYSLYISPTSAVLTLQRPNLEVAAPGETTDAFVETSDGITHDVMAVNFTGANVDAKVVALGELETRTNYFIGNTDAGHLTNIANFAQVKIENLYDGIDLVYYGNQQGKLEYDFIVRPGADMSVIRMEYQGANTMTVNADGDLVLTTASGEITHTAPLAYQKNEDGSLVQARKNKDSVGARYVLLGTNQVGLQVTGDVDESKELVIDPVLDYSTYLGGLGNDISYSIAVDGAGGAYVTGSTTSANFPTQDPFQSTLRGSQDIFVARLAPEGKTLMYATYIGGTAGGTGMGCEAGFAIAVDLAHNAFVTGTTNSSDFPTTPGAFQTAIRGPMDAFVLKLSPGGDALHYATYLGGTGGAFLEEGRAIAVDALGQAVVTGITPLPPPAPPPPGPPPPPGFPTTPGAFQTTFGGGSTDAFVTKLAADGKSLIYSSFLGGTGNDAGEGVTLDAGSNAFVAGSTTGAFPTTAGVVQGAYGGGASDAFVAKINASGSTKDYATYLGGAGADAAYDVVVDPARNAYVTGYAQAGFTTTPGAYQQVNAGGQDAFVTKLDATASTRLLSSFLGGSADDIGYGIALTEDKKVVLAGYTNSSNFPTVNPLQTDQPAEDAFISKLSATVSDLLFSTYLGGGGGIPPSPGANDQAYDMAVDVSGAIYVTGVTTSSNFPVTTGAFQTGFAGGQDAFITKILDGALAPPVITSITIDSGYSASDQITNDQTLVISGTATPSATVKLYKAGLYIGSTTSNGAGSWTFDFTTTALPEGSHPFRAVTVIGILLSAPSPIFMANVDLTNPVVKLSAPATTFSTRPRVDVWASDRYAFQPAGTNVWIDADFDNDGVFETLAIATGLLTKGHTSIAVNLPLPSTTGLRARVMDIAGNVGTSNSQTVQVVVRTDPWSLINGGVRTSDPGEGLSTAQLGNVSLVHALDFDRSPGSIQSGNPALVYNSNLVNVRPVVQTTFQTPNNIALPATLTATLTWNGGAAQAPVNFSTAGFVAGDVLTLGVQLSTPVATTGRYSWSMTLQGAGYPNMIASGVTCVRVEDASPFGAGWTLSNLNRLVAIPADANGPAGVIWLYGNGGHRFFQDNLNGTFAEPLEDNGELTKDLVTGIYTYLTPEGVRLEFNANGLQTSWKSTDGFELISFTGYNGIKLTAMTAIDGATTTFAYLNGGGALLSSISTAGPRSWQFTHTGTDLTRITDPDTRERAFAYNGTHKLTSETHGPVQNGWTYGTSTGLLSSMRWGNISSPTITTVVPVAAQGLTVPVLESPGAVFTDALGNQTVQELDFAGRLLALREANGATSFWTRDPAGRVIQFEDPLGRVTGYTRDGLGYVTVELLPDLNTRGYEYQAAFHRLKMFTDERGKVTEYDYDALGHLTLVKDAALQSTTYSYFPANGLLETITDPMMRVTTLSYDVFRRLTQQTTVLGNTKFTYHALTGEVGTTEDPLLRITTFGYDNRGRHTSTLYADTLSESWVYNGAGLLDSHTDRNNVLDRNVYDSYSRGLVVSVRQAENSGVQRSDLLRFDAAARVIGARDFMGYSTGFTLDSVGQTTKTTDPKANTTAAVYDIAGQVKESRDELGYWDKFAYNQRGWATHYTDENGHVWITGYDGTGNVTTFTDPKTHTWTNEYDAVGRLFKEINPLTKFTEYAYWADDSLKLVTDPRGFKTQITYDYTTKKITIIEALGTPKARTTEQTFDAVGNIKEVKDALGHKTYYEYTAVDFLHIVKNDLLKEWVYTLDGVGNVTMVKDPLLEETSFTFDALNRQTVVTDASGVKFTTLWNAADDLVGEVDGVGNTTQHIVDSMGLETLVIDPIFGRTTKTYDARSDILSLTDPAGNTTSWERDQVGLVTKQTDPWGKTELWEYDEANRLHFYTDTLGRQREYEYYNNNLLQTEKWRNTAGGPVVNTLSFTYDENDQVLTAGDGSGMLSVSYDELNRVKTQTDVWGIVRTNEYDSADRLLSVADTKGGFQEYAWDTADRLTSIKYSEPLNPTPQLRVDYAYTVRDQVATVKRYTDAAGATLVSETVYGYKDNGQVGSITHKNGSGATVDSFAYQYDTDGRVTQETSTLGPTRNYAYDGEDQLTADGTNSYTWDQNGNRTTTGWQYQTDNRITTDGTWTYSYNDEGAQTQKTHNTTGETWVYGYDLDNRLTHVEKRASAGGPSTLTVDFKYDIFGNRVEKAVDPDGAGPLAAALQRFAYDDIGNAWADLDGASSLTTRRIYDGTDSLLARFGPLGTEDWYLTDHLGSVRDLVGTTGLLINHRDYDSFGILTNETVPANGDRYGWTGRERDAEIDLQYNRARYYDAKLGRWISQDPIGFHAGDNNMYRYVNNSPVNGTDPSGLQEAGWIRRLDRLDMQGKVAEAAAARRDLGIAAHGAVNATATTVRTTATLGIVDQPWELVPVSDNVKGTTAYMGGFFLTRVGQEGYLAVLTGAASTAGKAGKVVFVVDSAQNLVSTSRGTYGIIREGPNLENITQTVGGSLGLGGNSLGMLSRQSSRTTGQLSLFSDEMTLLSLGRSRLWTQFSTNVRRYLTAIERHTGYRLHSTQRAYLLECLQTTGYTRLSAEAGRAHRGAFTTTVRNSQIAEWERRTQQVWPRYTQDVVNAQGTVLRSAGQHFDAHHVIENIYGGPHVWWNLTPARFPVEHQGGIHLEQILPTLFP